MSHTEEKTVTQEAPPEVYAQLEEAFRVFNDVSATFTDQYAKLEQRIKDLNLELEDANEQLRMNLEERRRMEEYLSTLLESLPTGVIGVSADGRVHSLNRAASTILQRDDKAASDVALDALFGPLEEDARATLGDIGKVVSEGGDAEVYYELALGRGEVQRPRVIRLQVVPTRGNESEVSQDADAVLLIEDVTDIRRLQQQANRNDRLMAMGEIAMNVAHEIRNPLGSIELFASMLQRELSDDETNGPLAEHICTGVRCLDHIVMNILQFSRPQQLSRSACDLRDIIDETVVFTEHALRQKKITLEKDHRGNGSPVWADAELLRQTFLNLLLNAIQATPEGGIIGVRTIPNGTKVEAQIWDTGLGFPAENLGRIFDPFFTTRRKGTGLGLTIVHNIVTSHDGTVDAENRPGGGAMFSIVLPKRQSNKQ